MALNDSLAGAVSGDKPLVDDLAWVLASTVVGWEPIIGHDLAKHPEVVRVMARYREERPIDERSD